MLIVADYHIHQYSEPMSDQALFHFCGANRGLRIERDADQNIIIMAPVGGGSGFFEKELITEIELWVRAQRKGASFSSSTGFLLPNGAMRSPDASWVSPERWQTLTEAQKIGFLPLTPDFVVEIRSQTDSLEKLRKKMEEWIGQGVRLAWLIDPLEQQVHIFRENGSIEIVEGLESKLSGEQIMPAFQFDLRQLRLP
jgi:Uma2 family endonuclease